MKLLHLSDLHIGKRVNECSMLEDQRYILEQIAQLAIERKVDGVLLAGDLYDKPVPPAEAVILLDTFFTALSQAGIPVFAISGNHDSPERLSFGARLLTGTGIYLSAVYQGPQEPVLLRDAYGEVAIYLLPYDECMRTSLLYGTVRVVKMRVVQLLLQRWRSLQAIPVYLEFTVQIQH